MIEANSRLEFLIIHEELTKKLAKVNFLKLVINRFEEIIRWYSKVRYERIFL